MVGVVPGDPGSNRGEILPVSTTHLSGAGREIDATEDYGRHGVEGRRGGGEDEDDGVVRGGGAGGGGGGGGDPAAVGDPTAGVVEAQRVRPPLLPLPPPRRLRPPHQHPPIPFLHGIIQLLSRYPFSSLILIPFPCRAQLNRPVQSHFFF